MWAWVQSLFRRRASWERGAKELEIYDRRDSSSGTLLVTPLGNDRYRVEEAPFCMPEGVICGDVIRLRASREGKLVYVETLESTWRQYDWMLNRKIVRSAGYKRLVSSLEDLGCRCCRIFEGIFIVSIPPTADLDAVHATLRKHDFKLPQPDDE